MNDAKRMALAMAMIMEPATLKLSTQSAWRFSFSQMNPAMAAAPTRATARGSQLASALMSPM